MTVFVRVLERIEVRTFPRAPWRERWINVAEIESIGSFDRADGAEVAYVRTRSGDVVHLYDHVSNVWSAVQAAQEAKT